MTDPTEPDADAPLDPATEARVRGLLRAAAERSPMPADVAARLDDVLAGLAAERAAASDPGSSPDPRAEPAPELVDLAAARRRRRVARGLLVAAAAVVVVGVGGTVVPRLGGSGNESDSAGVAESAPQDASADEEATPDSAGPAQVPEADAQDSAVTAVDTLAPYAGQVLDPLPGAALDLDADLGPQVADLLAAAAASPARATSAGCGEPGPDAVGVLTTYGGTPARVDVTVPGGGAGTVDVVVRACGTGERLDALRLARP
ncbi:hypothetical protein INN71_07190 [Nocardioides sp. ChNu-153]|uniref:hypothetical protein n=1 Tax=Nocardioides sp. ChNu-153 TaxID=2779364 RepID=UPI00264E517D|nr:hypothetical protein [Nocardioides sp. ChNu-153]MDN7121174.1 hypothetical protein [Nocardioides sp. ChNu-153]